MKSTTMKEDRILSGVVAPAGDGVVIEVHLDIMEASTVFLQGLNNLGFENDPFLDFFPEPYKFHYTGRARARQSDVSGMLPGIRALIDQVLAEARNANVKLYAESELVRDIHHFDETQSTPRTLSALDDLTFGIAGDAETAQADIHLEFRAGTVPDDVRNLLIANCFYWVRTPATKTFPSEEIATLQTATFRGARIVYDRLIANPLPASTGIHLEQKLAMIASHRNLPMPPAIAVTKG